MTKKWTIPYLVSLMEKKIASHRLLVSLLSRYYRKVVSREVNLAGVTSADQVLCVGCGGIPSTAIQTAKLTGAQVWAIDIDGEAVEAARRSIASLKMEEQIIAAEADGAGEIPFSFNVALVALQAEPKKEILDNLTKQGEPGVRLVFRRPRHHLFEQYDLLPSRPVPDRQVLQQQPTFDSSVLYLGNQENQGNQGSFRHLKAPAY